MASVTACTTDNSNADRNPEEDDLGDLLMQTRLLRGGRELEKLGGGTLYEMYSRYEGEQAKAQGRAFRQAFFEPQLAPGGAIKSSVQRKRTRVAKTPEHNFLCEGTMFRHTKKSWKDAPCELQPPHEVRIADSAPADILVREHLIEDLSPFSRDVYWIPVWRKCTVCQERDAAFRMWVARV